ncbi:lipopolysaccharide biosynthesis protein [Sphingomonas sp. CFBP8993]|uniref:lipopolysaccharide biosynthesis protein n=1 Tax=Sphingomonas sp. CFBP8993 TaxID=3096526 RepID=UPI003133A340
MRLAATFILHAFQIGYPAFITWLAAAMASQATGSEVVFYLGLGSLILVGLEYGFRYSGAREISLALGDAPRIAALIAAILLIQTVLLLVTLLVAGGAMSISVPAIGIGPAMCVLVFMIMNGIIPTWIFIALSLQKEFLLYTAPVRLIGLAAAMTAGHFHSLNGLFLSQCVAMFAIHVAGLTLLWRSGYLERVLPLRLATALLRDGRDVFVMKLGVFSYTSAGVLVLGIVQSPEMVGAFGLCQRLVTALQQASAPLFMSAYPLSVRHVAGEKGLANSLLRLNGGALLSSLAMSLGIAIGGTSLLRLIQLDHYAGILDCIRIMAPLPMLLGISTFLVNNAVLAAKRDDIVRTVTLVCGGIGIPAYFVMSQHYGLIGTAITLTAIEGCVALTYSIICLRAGLLPPLLYWRCRHEN